MTSRSPAFRRRQSKSRPATSAANDDRASRPAQVNWAGLPINLDFAFSREQCDKVYVQHVMRGQGRRLRRYHDDAQSCTCEVAADHERARTDAAGSMSSQ